MFQLNQVNNSEPSLENAPLIRSAQIVLQYLADNDTIGLTQTKAFQRKFVVWAAREFEWPDFDLESYFAISKVMNEYDFPPLEVLHFVLLKLKLIRRYKFTARLTKVGRDLIDKPGDLFNLIAPFYLLRFDHAVYSRISDPLPYDWNLWLSVLNVEAKKGVTCVALRQMLYGEPDSRELYDHMPGMISSQVISPLCWMGLLTEHGSWKKMSTDERTYTTSTLWTHAFRFPLQKVRPRLRLV